MSRAAAAAEFVRSLVMRAAFLRCAVVAVLLGCAVCAHAADDDKVIFPGGGSARTASPAPATGGSFNTISLVVAAVLGGVGAWVMWRNRRTQGLTRAVGRLAVEETKSLGNRQFLVVASYDGRKFLLGVCPGRIEMLSPLEDHEPVEQEP